MLALFLICIYIYMYKVVFILLFLCIGVTLKVTINQHLINVNELYCEAEMQRKEAPGLIVILSG